MSDDPSNAELGRRLDDLRILVQGLVSRDAYAADQRSTDYRFAGLKAELAEAQSDVSELRRDFAQHVRESAQHEDTGRRHWQTIILTGLLQAVIAVGAILVTIWTKGS